MDSGIDLNPPPPGSSSPGRQFFFWEGKGLRSCLGLVLGQLKSLLLFFFKIRQPGFKFDNFASSGLGQPLINCSYGAMSKWPALLEICRSGHLILFWVLPVADKLVHMAKYQKWQSKLKM